MTLPPNVALAASWHLSCRSLSPEGSSQDPQSCQHQGAPQNEGAACPATGRKAACGQRWSRHAGSTQPSLLSPHCAQSPTPGGERASRGQPGCRDEVAPVPGRKRLRPGTEETRTRVPLRGSGTTSLTDHRGSGHSSRPLGGRPGPRSSGRQRPRHHHPWLSHGEPASCPEPGGRALPWVQAHTAGRRRGAVGALRGCSGSRPPAPPTRAGPWRRLLCPGWTAPMGPGHRHPRAF